MKNVEKLVQNLSKNMLFYTFIIILSGIFVSIRCSVKFLSNYILIIVFLMIYPMMVNVSFESLKKIKNSKKPLLVALFFDFILSPLIYLILCMLLNVPSDIRIALILLAVAPASSMGLGYVGLSKGNMISASIIVASAFILSLVVYPITFHFLNISNNIIPFREILKSLVLVLILPLILGLITREWIIEKRGLEFKKVKPIFSLLTLIFLYILIFVIFSLKGKLIITHPHNVAIIAPLAIIFYAIMIITALFFDKYIVRLDYKDNQAIVFTTVSKNVALTIGLLATVFKSGGRIMAMYPAIISLFQIIFLMTYLRFSEHIEKWWMK